MAKPTVNRELNSLDFVGSIKRRAQIEEWIVGVIECDKLDKEYVDTFINGQLAKVSGMLKHLKVKAELQAEAKKKK